RYDFKGTSAKVELNEKDKLILIHGDSDFQLDQIKDLLFPAMEKKEKESTKRLDHQPVQRVSGNKVKQELKIKIGIESELAKKIVKLIKDSKMKVQASIQGDAVRVSGAKRDDLQACIALVTKTITDFPIKYGNFRD
ncbi:MAG TPA: YajQ family cyclic di-GMP-binding protein, partial [Accumulibacter sp.]|nr:YajQ family cyclic di-GMP-binding protein [Accumulibacter sp.]